MASPAWHYAEAERLLNEVGRFISGDLTIDGPRVAIVPSSMIQLYVGIAQAEAALATVGESTAMAAANLGKDHLG